MTDVRKYISVMLLVMFVFFAMSACAPSDIAHKPDKNDVYIKVDDETLSKEYIGYFFYLAQSAMLEEAGYSNSPAEDIKTYWETAKINEKDAVDVARDVAADNAISTKVQYLKAIDEGISITDDEKEMIESDINTSAQSQGGMKELEKFLVTKGTDIDAYRQTKLENVYIQKLYEKYDQSGLLEISESELSEYASSHDGEIDPEYILEYAKNDKFNSMAEQWKKDSKIIVDDSMMKYFDVEKE